MLNDIKNTLRTPRLFVFCKSAPFCMKFAGFFLLFAEIQNGLKFFSTF